jgi:hypothetical protein
MSDDQWAKSKLKELLDRVRNNTIKEYMARARELGLPWRQ